MKFRENEIVWVKARVAHPTPIGNELEVEIEGQKSLFVPVGEVCSATENKNSFAFGVRERDRDLLRQDWIDLWYGENMHPVAMQAKMIPFWNELFELFTAE